MELLQTYRMRGLFDFILYVFEQKQEDSVWELWMHSNSTESYADFKEKRTRTLRKKKLKQSTREEQEKAIQAAANFIKPIEEKEGGEANGNE